MINIIAKHIFFSAIKDIYIFIEENSLYLMMRIRLKKKEETNKQTNKQTNMGKHDLYKKKEENEFNHTHRATRARFVCQVLRINTVTKTRRIE